MGTYLTSLLLLSLMCFRGIVAPVSIQQLAQRSIKLSNGKIRGVMVQFPRQSPLKMVEGYFGIPFASGSFRFLPPTDAMLHSNIVKGTNDHLSCPQTKWRDRLFDGSDLPKANQIHFWRVMNSTKKQDESCLFLNIFVSPRGKCIQRL